MKTTVILRSSLKFEFLFRTTTAADAMNCALEECNGCLLEDFGPGHRLEPMHAPDLLVIGRDGEFEDEANKVVGLLTLHFADSTRAWELGTMSARKCYSHNVLFQLFMEHVPGVLAESIKDDTQAVWIVRRISQRKKVCINRLRRLGFAEPPHFLVGVLSNEGYIPFDPFEEVLLKMKVLPPALASAESESRARSIVFTA
jgi:hypothetical protein